MPKTICCVVPCLNEAQALPAFADAVNETAKALEGRAEVRALFVDDGSADGTLPLLRRLSKEDARFSYLSLSRNFGKEAAMLAGLEHAEGDYIAVMDADLQDPPEYLIPMFEALESGEYDSAALYREDRRGEKKVRSFFSNAFYAVFRFLTKTDIPNGARDFRLMTRRMTDCLLRMREHTRFTKGMMCWVGFRTKWIPCENRPRAAGKTKFPARKLMGYAADGITAFSDRPLKLAGGCGFLLCALAAAGFLFYFIKALLFGDPVTGFPTLVCLILLLGGIQLLSIGILSEYIARIYTESKQRPDYFIKEESGSGEESSTKSHSCA